jgi:hypothetical protein
MQNIHILGERHEAWREDDLFRSLERFEDILAKTCGVRLAGDAGGGERAVQQLLDLISAFRRENPDDLTKDVRPWLRRVVGLADLVKKAERVLLHKDFNQLCPHFRLLLARETEAVQSVESAVTDAASNKLFELLIALSVMQFSPAVMLDDPVQSDGRNPDVIGLVRGQRWGFGCKAMHSRKPKTYADAARRAIQQIDASPAERGFVVISLKNILDYDRYWRAVPDGGRIHYTAWDSVAEIDRDIEEHVTELLGDWEAAFGGQEELKKLFEGSRATPIILNYVNVVALVRRNGADVLTTLRRILPLALGIEENDETLAVIKSLDDAVQSP